MKNVMNFCSECDFVFILEYLAYNEIDINSCDDIDELYREVLKSFQAFEISPEFIQSGSYLQAVKDFLKDN